MTEGETVGWHHQFNGHEFEQAPGDGEGQGKLTCCSPWGCKESDMTEHLLLGREAITNLASILKSRDITLPTKVHAVKAVIFPAVMHGCDSWTCASEACAGAGDQNHPQVKNNPGRQNSCLRRPYRQLRK